MEKTLKYLLVQKDQINESQRGIVAEMLSEQMKVQPPYEHKVDRCKIICIVYFKENPIGLGAIKEKTKTAFNAEKANLQELASKFNNELGYIYVKKKFEGQGIASSIVSLLLDLYGNENLMSSTEITANPGMVKILERFEFRHYGNTWQSRIHSSKLGLFLRIKQ